MMYSKPPSTMRQYSGFGTAAQTHERVLFLIDQGKVDLVINIPREFDQHGRPDGYQIRRRAVAR